MLRRDASRGLKTPRVVARCMAPKSRLFADFAEAKSVPMEAAAAQAKPSVWLACRRVWRNVARQSKSGSRVAAPIVMIPTLDVESILRTWTPDSPCDVPLKGAQAASRQPSQPTRPAFAGLSAEARSHLYTRAVRSRDARMPPLLLGILLLLPPRRL